MLVSNGGRGGMIYAVLDTNVIVSALITKNENSPVVEILKRAYAGNFKVLVNDAILAEYRGVLERPKFGLNQKQIEEAVTSLANIAIHVDTPASSITLPDPKDVVFYEVALTHQNKRASLVTGNLKHFPNVLFAISPRDFLDKLKLEDMLNSYMKVAAVGQMLNDCRGYYFV